jgi:hypothetical protein
MMHYDSITIGWGRRCSDQDDIEVVEAIPNPTNYSKNSAYYLRIENFCGRLTYYLFDYSFET